MQQDNKNEVHVIHENRYYYYDRTSGGGYLFVLFIALILSILASIVSVFILPALAFFESVKKSL